jgi:hypothetical protein
MSLTSGLLRLKIENDELLSAAEKSKLETSRRSNRCAALRKTKLLIPILFILYLNVFIIFTRFAFEKLNVYKKY